MEAQDAIQAFAALAQETRLAVFRLLVIAGPQGRAAGDIAAELGLAPATLSFHLNHLRHAGLVAQRRESRSLIYSARFETVQALLGFLMRDCCQGQIAPDSLQPACSATAPTPQPKGTAK